MAFKITAAVFLFLFAFNAFAKPGLPTQLRTDIQQACSDKVRKSKSANDARELCGCIANKHFVSALKEPDLYEAKKQLKWAADYYRAQTEKHAERVVSRLPYMAEFDLAAAEECANLADPNGAH